MDFFPIPEDFDLDPAHALETASRQFGSSYGRYLEGVRAIIRSYDIPVGLTPKREIWRLNKAKLYYYEPICPPEKRYPIPLFLVYALINKPFIFDLVPGRSFVEYMLGEGFEIYLLDWGAPGLEDASLSFDDYVTEYLTRAVRRVLRHSGAATFSMLGYCIGATLATIYAAAYPQAKLENLILLTAPIDFSEEPQGSMAVWLGKGKLDIDGLLASEGNIPGELIALWAKMLKPMENFVGSYTTLFKQLGDPAAVHGWQAINRWVEDVIPFSSNAFRQYVEEYMRGNELVSGTHQINGQTIKLANISANLLNVIAMYDHLVSREQSETIMDLVSSTDKETKIIPSTHVGIMASRRAKYKLWPELADWLSARSGQPQAEIH